MVKISNQKSVVYKKRGSWILSIILLFIVGICWFCAFFPSATIREPKTTDSFHYHESSASE